ncbi:Uma2 family endonuclease [Lichenibacterium dinghuense]|uniref:Uma2 family endonuclease n=1 Tax=Lichenibacterium dinghuense TaxID=2895977 RepID=UPI001F28360F|nr:Uma2 family endonuclease [Lichenibacterium sp. 6Y81]
MSLAKGAEPGRSWMPVEDFRAFQTTRPDGEGWELIDGVPVMMTPTSVNHARIAGNVERLLCDALDAFDPARTALHGRRCLPGHAAAARPRAALIRTSPSPGATPSAPRC